MSLRNISARVFLVMSSFVGPSPPVMTVTSEPARARSAVSMICVRSSPIEIFSRTTMPAALRCLAMETELVSTICPMSISSPMVMMVAFMCGVIFVRTRGGVPLPIRRRMPSRRSRRPPGRMLRGFPRFARTPRRRAWRYYLQQPFASTARMAAGFSAAAISSRHTALTIPGPL